MTDDELRESRLRHRARARGYRVEKSRRRQDVDNRGEYQVIENSRNVVVLGVRFDANLDDVEAFLADEALHA